MIETKVARILSDTKIVLAKGLEHGVKDGMVFVIYELSEKIFDPESGDDLGQLELVKGRVRVHHTQEKLSIASTIPESTSTLLPGIYRHLLSTKMEYPRLNVEESSVATVQAPTRVKIGDLARSVEFTEE